MRKAREYKALARQRMFRKFGTLAGATASVLIIAPISIIISSEIKKNP